MPGLAWAFTITAARTGGCLLPRAARGADQQSKWEECPRQGCNEAFMVQRRAPGKTGHKVWPETFLRYSCMFPSLCFSPLHPISKRVVRALGSLTSGIFALLVAQSVCVWGKEICLETLLAH